jgi:hypothetical protein
VHSQEAVHGLNRGGVSAWRGLGCGFEVKDDEDFVRAASVG